MDTWNLTNEQREKFKPVILEYINKVNNADECESVEKLDLTFKGISSYQLQKLLEELGYKELDFDSNGWQFDFWIKMYNKDNTRAGRLTISGCGMSFELKLSPTD